MAEVHIVGSLVGGKDFEESSLFCKWQLITDDGRPDNKRCAPCCRPAGAAAPAPAVRAGGRSATAAPERTAPSCRARRLGCVFALCSTLSRTRRPDLPGARVQVDDAGGKRKRADASGCQHQRRHQRVGDPDRCMACCCCCCSSSSSCSCSCCCARRRARAGGVDAALAERRREAARCLHHMPSVPNTRTRSHQVHYSTTTIHGWPKLSCEVWSQDEHGRNTLAGYGFCHIPTSAGDYDLRVCCWRPKPQRSLKLN